ncbi:AGR064Cp [Eremothecium gossypii ATCC 10895]|uniref:AGR064Cp n=1 Tax=Eremothecium gossypii (strain ATCC 10895 / CBS 109.51 / FGSC 9923 / NRRL Y-1056) TaxID=284811 RepID=Q74ZZ3_EREGS|nr:AGR064Cp [Eremothecium gossypii ATCC 10895]AAS54553.1 AGR064Cp [Eremothecium gossypii ATCC 10895]AEY98885.1 FAGR064Cp [Eremothecium gossypii FDAG1]
MLYSQRPAAIEADRQYWRQQLRLLEHIQRVNCGQQLLFNSFLVQHDVLRACNNERWANFGMDKFKCLFQLNELLKSMELDEKQLDEKQLYKINEKVSFLLHEIQPKTTLYLLDGQVITTVLLNVLVCICEMIIKFNPRSELHVVLCRCIVNGISSQFLQPYVQQLWNAVQE